MEWKTEFSRTIFEQKYRNSAGGCGTWEELCDTLVQRVCSDLMSKGDMTQLAAYMRDMKFIPAGRYLYYAGRDAAFFNNCFSFIGEKVGRTLGISILWHSWSVAVVVHTTVTSDQREKLLAELVDILPAQSLLCLL